MRVGVIGGGILGASVAWHLRRLGATVTVYDRGGSSATAGSFAWINASWANDPVYRALRLDSMARWPALASALPDVGFKACGGLLWDLDEAALRAFAAEVGDYGRLVDCTEAAALEPALQDPPALAFHAPGEAMVEAPLAAAALAGSVVPGEAILDAVQGRPGVRRGDTVEGFDAVVVAAGVASDSVLAPSGVRLAMTAPSGMLARSRPAARVLNGLVMMPDMHLRQDARGRVVIGEDYAGSDPGEGAAALAQALVAEAGRRLGVALAFDRLTRAGRPTPGDGRPAVGALPLPGVYLALSHSGVTLAPSIGAMLAREVVTGERDPLIAPYAPERLVQPV